MERMTVEQYRQLSQVDPKRSYIGRVNKAQGESFENLIDAACEYYKMNGIAYIKKTPEPMRPISKQMKDGSFKAVFVKKAQADYRGVLKGGKAIAFEAKHTIKDRLQQSCVSTEQSDDLDSMQEMDARCFVLCSFGFSRFFRVPWGVWKNMKQIYGRKYVTPADIEQYEITYNGTLLFLNESEVLPND